MRKQYHARLVGQDRHIWDIHRLVKLSSNLPPFEVPINDIVEIDEDWWYAEQEAVPTPRSIAVHMALADSACLSHPIILCAEGRLMDGMHRVVKALRERRQTILAVRFPITPEPDYLNVPLSDLPYSADPDKQGRG